MSILSGLLARVRAAVARRRADRELSEEIAHHIALETEKNLRAGYSPAEARRLAFVHFGGVQRAREDHRDVRRLQWIEDIGADARFALRALRHAPASAGAAIITLALGIGANVAIFSAVNAVVLRPLPFAQPDRLVMITEENPEKHWHLQTAAPANLLDWRAGVAGFQDVTGYASFGAQETLTGYGAPQVLNETLVMGNFFSLLGIRAELGRTFADAESWQSAAHPIVLSDRAWRERFGTDPAIVGKSIVLNGAPGQVVGVAPPTFLFPRENVDLWRPVAWAPADRAAAYFRRAHWMRPIARLKSGVTLEQANAQLQTVVSRLKVEYPATNEYMGAAMMPLHDFLVGSTRLPLLVLMTSVVLLLLIACVNVGNLLLVQASTREREATLRLALGADRGRLVRQALTESLILALFGGVLGLFLGWAGTHALVRMQPEGMLPVRTFGIDGVVTAYVAAISVLAALLFGIAPALWMRHRDPADSLKDGGRGAGQSRRVRRWTEGLVVVEVALALLMMVGAGLLVRSFVRITDVDPGFRTDGVLAVSLSLNQKYDSASKRLAFDEQVLTRAAAIPGVTDAAMATSVPFLGTGYTSDFTAYGRGPDGYGTELGHRTVSPTYFTAMRVRLLRGRLFNAADRPTSPPVVIVNEAVARSYFTGEDPVGQRIAFDRVPTPKSVWYTVVGVVSNEHVDALDVAPRTEAFVSTEQFPPGGGYVLMHTNGNPAALLDPFRDIVHQIDPTLALSDVQTMATLRAASLARVRFLTTMLIAFAVIGLALAVVGVYGVLAQVSRNRMREMGIRIALGAPVGALRWLIVRAGLKLTAIGLVAGGVTAAFTAGALSKLLFGVPPRDPVTMVAVALVLVATSLIAAWLPARRASRVDPVVALRAD